MRVYMQAYRRDGSVARELRRLEGKPEDYKIKVIRGLLKQMEPRGRFKNVAEYLWQNI